MTPPRGRASGPSRALRAVLVALALAGATACGGAPSKGADGLPASGPLSFVDGLPDGPRLVVSVRVARALGDRVYGPLLRYALREAAGAGGPPSLARMVDVAESADSIVAVVGDGPDDLLVVLRQVGASWRPEQVAADDGRPLFREVRKTAAADELAPRTEDGSALFVFPGRVWALARGAARDRMRESLAGGRRAKTGLAEADGIVAVAADARALGRLGVVPRAGGLSLLLGPGLERAEVGLEPEARGVKATLAYQTEDGAKRGEEAAARLLEALKKDGDARTAWLGQGVVARSGREVAVEAKLPEALVAALLPRETDGPRAPRIRAGAALPSAPEAPEPTEPGGATPESPSFDVFGGLRKKRTDRPAGL